MFGSMYAVWKAKNIQMQTKVRVYEATILSILLYASETWEMTVRDRQRLDAFHHKCLRRILNISWRDHITNEDVRNQSNHKLLSQIIAKRRLTWLGHVLRMPENSIVRMAITWKPEGGKRKRGRPHLTWWRTIKRDLTDRDTTWNEAVLVAQDRRQWRTLADQCPHVDGTS